MADPIILFVEPGNLRMRLTKEREAKELAQASGRIVVIIEGKPGDVVPATPYAEREAALRHVYIQLEREQATDPTVRSYLIGLNRSRVPVIDELCSCIRVLVKQKQNLQQPLPFPCTHERIDIASEKCVDCGMPRSQMYVKKTPAHNDGQRRCEKCGSFNVKTMASTRPITNDDGVVYDHQYLGSYHLCGVCGHQKPFALIEIDDPGKAARTEEARKLVEDTIEKKMKAAREYAGNRYENADDEPKAEYVEKPQS